MRGKVKVLVCGFIFLGLASATGSFASGLMVDVQRLSELLSPDKIGVLYRDEISRDIANLRATIAFWELVAFTLFLSGLVLLIVFFLPVSKERRKSLVMFLPKPTVVSLIFLLVTVGLMEVQVSYAENLYIRPRGELPKTITLYGGATRTFEEASASLRVNVESRVSAYFTAYLLAVGNPTTEEFIEAGFVQNTSGNYLYSSSIVNGAYTLVVYGRGVLGVDYGLQVVSIGSLAYVKVNDVLVHQITFSDTHNLEFVVQGETPYVFNEMAGNFTEMQVGYWKWDDSGINSVGVSGKDVLPAGWVYVYSGWPRDYVTVVNEAPYTVSLKTESPAIVEAFIYGRLNYPNPNPNTDNEGGGGQTPKTF